MVMGQTRYVHMEGCFIQKATEKALLVHYNGVVYWLPRSMVSNGDNFDTGDRDVTISIPERIAEEKGIEVEE